MLYGSGGLHYHSSLRSVKKLKCQEIEKVFESFPASVYFDVTITVWKGAWNICLARHRRVTFVHAAFVTRLKMCCICVK